MGYVTKAEQERYDTLKSKHNGLTQLLNILLISDWRDNMVSGQPRTYSETQLIKHIDLIVDVIGALPLIDGAWDEEVASIMKEKLNHLDEAKEHYEKRCEEVEEQLKTELKDIPKREREVESKLRALNDANDEIGAKKFFLENQIKKFEALKLEHEEERKKIMEFETPEGRDRARLAILYLDQVPRNQWNDKAIAWSLGAIYSGGQIPNFGKKE